MACVKDNSLSATDIKILESIKDEFLSIEEIASKTNVPMFKLRSTLRKLTENKKVIVKDDLYKVY